MFYNKFCSIVSYSAIKVVVVVVVVVVVGVVVVVVAVVVGQTFLPISSN